MAERKCSSPGRWDGAEHSRSGGHRNLEEMIELFLKISEDNEDTKLVVGCRKS